MPSGKPLTNEDIIMKALKNTLIAVCLAAVLAVAFGCSEEGPMEKAGKKIDKAAQEAGQQMDKAAEEAGNAAKKLFE
jgi:ABC-type Fe3+ transport system permease subunit